MSELEKQQEQMLYENTRDLLNSGSTEFLTVDELNYLKKFTNASILNFVRGYSVPGIRDALDFNENIENALQGQLPASSQELMAMYDATCNLAKSPDNTPQTRAHLQNICGRLLNYAKSCKENPFDASTYDNEWVNRHVAFTSNNVENAAPFYIRPNYLLGTIPLPQNALEKSEIFGKDSTIDLMLKELGGVSKNELLAAITLDSLLNGESHARSPESWTFDDYYGRWKKLLKSKFAAGQGAPYQNVYSIYDNYNARIISRYGAMGAYLLDCLERKSRTQENLELMKKLDHTIEDARVRPYTAESPAIPLDYDSNQAILDYYIDLLEANGKDADWLKSLSPGDFRIEFDKLNPLTEDSARVGAATTPSKTGDGSILSVVHVNLNHPSYELAGFSDKLKSDLFHELRHVWQRKQSDWRKLFAENNPIGKTDMDVEVDAFENQFNVDEILGLDDDFHRELKSYNNLKDESEDQKKIDKARYVFFKKKYNEAYKKENGEKSNIYYYKKSPNRDEQ